MVTERSHNRYRTETVRGVAIILAVFLVSLFYLTICMNRNVNVYDEGFILFDATRILDGDIPHRDFYSNYGPGQIYVLALLYKIFGISVLVERVWDTIVRGLIVVLVLIVVNQAAPRWTALLAAGASLVCLAYVGVYSYPMYPALAASLGGVAFLAPALARRNSIAALTAAGACAGIATLFRYDIGIGVFGSECAMLAFSAWHRRRNSGRGMRDAISLLGPFAAGFAVLVLPVIVAFVLAGAIPDILFQVVNYSAKFYTRTRGLPFPRPWNSTGDLTSLAVYLPLGCCAAAVPVLIACARHQTTNEVAEKSEGPEAVTASILPWTVATLVVVTLLFFAKGAVRVGVVAMGVSLITTMALAGVLMQPVPGRGRVGFGILGLTLLGAVAFILSCLRTELTYQFEKNVAWAGDLASWERSATGKVPDQGSCWMPPGLERLACFRVTPAEIDTIQFVQRRTALGEPIFVGLGRHDKILLNDVLLYFAANRRAITKWHQFDPGMQTSLPIQQEIIRELRQAKPRLIVLEANWDNAREPNDSAVSSGVTVLDEFIRSAFDPVATFGEITVLAARP